MSAEIVIQDYLTFSVPQDELIEKFNVQRELKHVIHLLKPLANQSSVKVSTNFSIDCMIEGDRMKFHQSFHNIIKNAIESMSYGGQLTIETEYIQENVIIRVIDTGAGMTKEQLDRLGEPYYSTKGDKGTGLGLMVVFSIVRAMNGTIHVESEVGVGTTFEFVFSATLSNLDNFEAEKREKDLITS